MKIKVAVRALENALRKLSSVEGKGSMPVLTYARAVAGLGSLNLSATDLEATARLAVKSENDGVGEILLPIKKLLGLLSTFEGEVTIATGKGNTLTVASGGYKGNLTTYAPADFPQLEAVPETGGHVLNLPILKKMAERVIFAIVQSEQKFVVSCGLLESDGKQVTLVGTDGNRMPLATAAFDAGVFSFVIPKRALSLLNDLDGETVTLFDSDQAYFFVTETATVSMQKANAQFPPYKSILPTTFKSEVIIQTAALKAALDRAKIVAEQKRPVVALEATEGVAALLVSAMSVEAGDSSDQILAAITGPGFRVGLNADQLTEFIGHVEGEIRIRISDPTAAVDFLSGDSYRYVVMPLMLVNPAAAEPTA